MNADQITNKVAGAAVASPFWLPWLADVSQLAGFMLPILGVAWLLVQIISKLIGKSR